MRYQRLLFIVLLTVSQLSCSKEQSKTISISAHFAEDDVKTILAADGISSLWQPKEEISVFFNNEGQKFVSTNNVASSTTSFEKAVSSTVQASGYVYGIYPYSTDNMRVGDILTLTVASNQTALAGSYAKGAFPLAGRSTSQEMGFYNICGGIRFTVSQKGITGITVSGKNNEYIAGRIKIQFDANGKPEIFGVVSGEKSITLQAPDGKEFEQGKWYYVAVIPTVFSSGLTIKVIKGGVSAERTLSKKTIARSKFGSIAEVDKGLVFDTSPSYPKWPEMPVIYDQNGDGISDVNNRLYYACHSFTVVTKKMRNYTVCYDSEHICPLWVSAPRHSCYKGSSGRTEAYKADPDIPSSYQYSSKSTGGGCNKGHMLGSSERTYSKDCNSQVFYYSNIAPQLSSGFNTGGGGWNKLEDWVDKQVPADTLYEVVGCYFEKFTDGYGYTVEPATISFGGRSNVTRPSMFYYVLLCTKKGNSGKNVCDCTADELKCAAFVRAHTNSLKGQAVTSKEMMSVAELEKITGVTYFPNIPNAPKEKLTPSDWGL